MLVKSRSADEDAAFRSIHLRRGFERERRGTRRVTRVESGGGLCALTLMPCAYSKL